MGCESCETQCPAILYATEGIREIDTSLAAIDTREQVQQQAAAEWDTQITTNCGEPSASEVRGLDGFEGFVEIGRANDDARRQSLLRQRGDLTTQARQRREACTEGPRDGFFGIGIGRIGCRSAIRGDDLPNVGERPSN